MSDYLVYVDNLDDINVWGDVRRALFPRYFGVGKLMFVEREDGAVYMLGTDATGADAWKRARLPPIPTEDEDPLVPVDDAGVHALSRLT